MRVETPELVHAEGSAEWVNVDCWYDFWACDSGLREWNIEVTDRIVLVLSDKPVRGAQRSVVGVTIAYYEMRMLLRELFGERMERRPPVWWWPEIVVD